MLATWRNRFVNTDSSSAEDWKIRKEILGSNGVISLRFANREVSFTSLVYMGMQLHQQLLHQSS